MIVGDVGMYHSRRDWMFVPQDMLRITDIYQDVFGQGRF